jgi:hypothetical protein
MNNTRQTFTLTLKSIGQPFEGFEEVISPAYINTWSDACSILSTRSYPPGIGTIEINVSWNEVKNKLKEFPSFDEIVKMAKEVAERGGTFPDFTRCEVECEVLLRKRPATDLPAESQRKLAWESLHLFLVDTFMAMNLSSPGCCDFLGATLSCNEDSHQEEYLNIYGDPLAAAWFHSLDRGWPEIQYVPLERVVTWLHSLMDIHTRQLASSRIERAIFSLYHVCYESKLTPTLLIWLAHALESLYDTPPNLVSRHLQRRIIQVLDAPIEQQKRIKKQLRQFYDLRSSFVHGNLDIPHPLEDESVDDRVEEFRVSLLDPIDLAVGIVLSTLQKHITENWREVVFSETYEGLPITV